MTGHATELCFNLVISESDADAERLDELTGHLMHDLLELDVESVKRVQSDFVPDQAKGDAFTLGALALVTMPVMLPGLVRFLQAWTLRGENRRITIKTPAGLEVAFVPEEKLSEAKLVALAEKLMATSPDVGTTSQKVRGRKIDLAELLHLLSTHFDEGELRTLCFELGVEYDDLPDAGKANKARELIRYLDRRNQIHELLELVKQLRPDVPWEKLWQ